MQKIAIDVMVNNGRTFYHTLHYPYCPLFKFDLDAMTVWLFQKLPSLKHRTDTTLFLKFPDGQEVQCQLIPNKHHHSH